MGNETAPVQGLQKMTTWQSLQVAWLGNANLPIDLTEVKLKK
jgi:hypothetical protein